MRIAIYVPLLLSCILGVSIGPIARLLAPRDAARMLTAAGVAATATLVGSLALLAVVGAAQHDHLVPHLIPSPLPLIGALFVVYTLFAAIRTGLCLRATMINIEQAFPFTGSHTPEICVVNDDLYSYALALAGRWQRIIISTALLSRLDADQTMVVIAHERCHLAHNHHRYRFVARVAGANPLLRRLPGHVDHALERWADEEAAKHVGSRILVTQALGTAALAASTTKRPSGVGLAFANDRIVDRMTAMLRPPSPTRRYLDAIALVLPLIALCSTFDAFNDFLRFVPV